MHPPEDKPSAEVRSLCWPRAVQLYWPRVPPDVERDLRSGAVGRTFPEHGRC